MILYTKWNHDVVIGFYLLCVIMSRSFLRLEDEDIISLIDLDFRVREKFGEEKVVVKLL